MDFESDEAFEAWLRAQSRDLCVMIAVRAAMRVWPVLERSGLQGKAEIAILGAGRALMAAGLPKGPKVPGLPPADAAIPRHDACGPAYDAIATAALVANTSGAEKRASLTRQAVHQAAEASAMTVSVRAIPITAEQAREPVRARSKALAYLDADKSVDELRSAALGGGSNMDLGHDPLSVHNKSFAFWSRWFDAAERGAPLDFELQRRIVTEIPDDVWTGEDAPRRVAAQIARIEVEFLANTTSLSEVVSLNPKTGKFRVDPAPMENAPLIGAMLSRTEDALDDALQGRNGLRDDLRDVRVLRRTHARYANDPQRIELDYTSVAISLRRLFKSEELAETDDNLALAEAVEEGALAIRAHHPEVARNRERLAQQSLKELPQEDRARLEEALPLLVDLSEDPLRDDFARDIPNLINDATLPLPSGAPPLPGMVEATRIFYRVSRMKLLWDDLATQGRENIEHLARFVDSDIGKVSLFLGTLVSIGLGIFGVL